MSIILLGGKNVSRGTNMVSRGSSVILLGGNIVSRGSSMKEAARDVIDVQIPALRDLCDSAHLSIDNVDVFCEEGVFDRETSAAILRAGQEAGWKVNFHGDELRPMEAGLVSVSVGI